MKSWHKRKSVPAFNSSNLQRAGIITAALALVLGPGRALAQRSLGVDVSSYQGGGINWSSVKGAGISFAWAKATEGTYDDDADFTINENNGKGAGVVMGAYHFARPDLDSPGTEASFFWSDAGGYIQADGKTLMPMLDMETWNGVVGASSYSAWANQWCNAVVSDASGQGVSIKPFIYVSACSACEFNTSVSGWLSDIANYNGENPQTGGPWNVCGNCAVWGSGVWTAWQYSSSGSVSGISGNVDEDVLGGSLSSCIATSTANPHVNPIVALNSDGRQELFVVGKTGNLYHNYQTNANGAWSGWISLGGTWAQNSQPAVGRNSDGRLEVFIIGTDGQMNHAWEGTAGNSSSWSGWAQLGGHWTQTAKVDCGVNADGALDVFVVGTDGQLNHDYQTSGGNWSGWNIMGGSWSQNVDIAAISDADGRQEVLLIGNTGNLYTTFQTSANGNWSGFTDLGGSFSQTARTAVARNSDGRLEAFIIGSGGALYHAYQTTAGGGWSGWSSLGGTWESDAQPVANSDLNGALEIGLIGSTGYFYHNYQNTSGWSGWISLGSSFSQNIRPVLGKNQDGRLEAFMTGKGSDLVHAYETAPNSATWSGWGSLGGSWN